MKLFSSLNRLSFWCVRHAEFSVALLVCLPSLGLAVVGLPLAVAVTNSALFVLAFFVSFGKRKKMTVTGQTVNNTSLSWSIAALAYGVLALAGWLHEQQSPAVLVVSLTTTLLLLLNERRIRRKVAFRRVARRHRQHRYWQAERNRLEKQWNERLQWLAGIQHDIRQPLHAMDLLMLNAKIKASSGKSEDLGRLQACQRWLSELAENTMEIAKMELDRAGRPPLLLSKQGTVRDVFNDILSWVRPMADSKGLAIHVCGADNLVTTDIKRLKRVLINLLHNGIRHTENGAVELAYRREKGGVHCFSVSDTGPGLPQDVIQQIEQPFDHVSGQLPKRGLGLFVVKSFCFEQGWHLTLEHSDASGTCFTVRLLDRVPCNTTHKHLRVQRQA